MKKFISWLEEKILPIAGVIEQNKYISSIQYGIMLTTPLLLVGAFACIIGEIPIKTYKNLMISCLQHLLTFIHRHGIILIKNNIHRKAMI